MDSPRPHETTSRSAGTRRLARVHRQLATPPRNPAGPGPRPAAAAAAADVHAYVNQIANGAHIPSVGLGCAYVGDDTTGLTQEAQTVELVTAALNTGCAFGAFVLRQFDVAPLPPARTASAFARVVPRRQFSARVRM
eukprot:SAG22_NODE_767_length_7375_cov_24.094055_4_plen_137_part_00